MQAGDVARRRNLDPRAPLGTEAAPGRLAC